MVLNKFFKRNNPILISLIIVYLLAACNGAQPDPTQPQTEPQTEAQVLITSTATTVPEPTATPTELPKSADVIVLVDEASASDVVDTYGTFLHTWSSENNLSLEFQPNLMVNAIRENTRIVLLFTNPPNLNALLSNAPLVEFINLSADPLPTAENLFSIPTASSLDAEIAFTAGYLAALLNPEYRIGFIGLQGEQYSLYATAYRTGAEFFCGLCNPIHPPYVNYPVSAIMPAENQNDAIAALDEMLLDSVELVFISPNISSQEALTRFAISGLQLIGSPAQAEHLGNNLVATIGTDQITMLEEVLDSIALSQPIEISSSPILITPVNDEALTTGKLNHIIGILSELLDGYYYPGTE